MQAGATLGRYRLLRPLGAGGAGQVWEAELQGPHGFRKLVALKLIDGARGERGRQALIREARLGAMLHHPHIVDVYELGVVGPTVFVAMERVAGPDLNRVLRACRPLPPRAALQAATHVTRALVRAHERGVVHRDLKPSNLLVDPAGLVKVADFGIARLAGTRADVEGTRGYMSPEQLQGAEVGLPSDLFSLGVVVGVLFLGRRPRSPDEAEATEAVLPGLGQVVAACLSPEPGARPSASRLLASLEALDGHAHGAGLTDLIAELSGTGSSPGAPTRAMTPSAGNLPLEADTFVGRGTDLDALEAAFAAARLVTLKGIGGLGKTRLALRWARQRPRPGGAWFCDLSEATTLPGVLHAIAAPLGVPLDRGGSADLARRLGQALRGRGDVLVVLDNAEQVVEAVATVARALLDEAPDVRVLVTSREPLLVGGEQVIELSPLGEEEAVALLRSRARGWRPGPDDEEPLIALARFLEGLPLALELAAARLPLLGPARTLERLKRSLRTLGDRRRDRPARQATLEGVVQWSWDLLDEPERDALAALSVFRGGFDLEAAEAVMDDDPDLPFALDRLAALVDRSLVAVRTVDGEQRFFLFEMVRAFAERRLSDDQALARHARWFADLAGPSTIAAAESSSELRARLAREVDNLVVASDRSVASGDAATALRTFRAAWWLHADRGPYAPMAERGEALLRLAHPHRDAVVLKQVVATAQWRLGNLERALALCTRAVEEAASLDAAERASALRMRGTMLDAAGRSEEALQHFEQAIALAVEAGSLLAEQPARTGHGIALRALGRRHEALEELARARQLAQRIGYASMLPRAANNHAMILADLGHLDEAEAAYREAIEQARRIGAIRSEATALGSLATILAEVGRLEEGVAMLRRSQALRERLGDAQLSALGLVNLAEMLRELGRLDEAEAALEASRPYLAGEAARRWAGLAHTVEAALRVDLGDAEGALRAGEQAVAVFEAAGDAWGVGCGLGVRGQARMVAGDLDAARLDLDASVEKLEAVGDRLQAAVTRCTRAELSLRRGDRAGAERDLADARATAAALGVGPGAWLSKRLAAVGADHDGRDG